MRAETWEGRPVEAWRRRWGLPGLEVHDVLASTNDRARDLADAGAPPGTTVLADHQTRGRGRRGRVWVSAPGTGLLLSTLAPGGGGATVAPLLAGLAVTRAIRALAPAVPARIKWPNDVLVEGRKVCGILCEVASGGRVVVGVGVNVAAAPGALPSELRASVTSLEEAAGGPVPRSELAGAVLEELARLLVGPAERLTPDQAAEIAGLDALLDRPLTAGPGVSGVGAGIAPDGALRVRLPDGSVRAVHGGSVRLVDEAGVADVPHAPRTPINGA